MLRFERVLDSLEEPVEVDDIDSQCKANGSVDYENIGIKQHEVTYLILHVKAEDVGKGIEVFDDAK